MKTLKKIALAGSLLFSASIANSWKNEFSTSPFQEILQSYQKTNSDYQKNKLQVEALNPQRRLLLSSLSPKVYANGYWQNSYSETQDKLIGDGTSEIAGLNLSAQWELTALLKKGQEYRAALWAEKSSILSLKNNENFLELKLLQLYLKSSFLNENYKTLQSINIENKKITLELQKKYTLGLITKSDYLRQKKQVLAVDIQLLNQEKLLESSLITLAKESGLNLTRLKELLNSNLSNPPKFENTISVENNIDLKSKDLLLKAREIQLNASFWNFGPKIDLSGQWGYENKVFNSGSWDENANVRLSISLPLFVGGSNLATTTQKRIELREATLELEKAKNEILANSTSIFNTYEFNQKSLSLKEEKNTLSQEILEIANSEFNAGLISYSDWLTIKISTENDNLEMIQSKYDLWETWVQWKLLIGPQGNEVDFE